MESVMYEFKRWDFNTQFPLFHGRKMMLKISSLLTELSHCGTQTSNLLNCTDTVAWKEL